MSKPGVDPTSGISSGDVLILPERHPACRRRETQLGFPMERENLAGDGKGKGTSGDNREAESTDAPERGALPCSVSSASLGRWNETIRKSLPGFFLPPITSKSQSVIARLFGSPAAIGTPPTSPTLIH